jgi:tRNA nucleotidyltransferase (CCA-adding enzyme)
MALLAGYGTVVLRSVANRLQMSSAQSAAVAQAGRLTDRVAMELSHRNELRPSKIYRLLSGLPDEAVVLTAAKSRRLAGSEGARICRQRLARYLTRDRHIRIVVGGDDLKRLGLKPGPAFKRILDRLLDTKIDGGTTTEEAERALAARLAGRALTRFRRLE